MSSRGWVRRFLRTQLRSPTRTTALAGAARDLGVAFSPEPDHGLPWLSGFFLTSWADEKCASNRLHGEIRGVAVAIFDYRWRRDRTNWIEETVAKFGAAELLLPRFRLQLNPPKFGSPPGVREIDLPAHPHFSTMFALQAADGDGAAVSRLFDDGLVRSLPQREGRFVEGAPEGLVVYDRGKKVPPDGVRQFLDDALWIFGLFAEAAGRAARAR